VSALTDAVVDRTIALARIPAPTGAEGERAALVRSWWRSDGLDRVRVDEAGNVWAPAREGDGSIVIVCAHLDTVFGPEIDHGVRRDDGRLFGPSVGDDSVGVAALSAIAARLATGSMPVWLLATVGEEGLGNLSGVTAALEDPPAAVAGLIAVEGNYLGRVSTVGVGSVRTRVQVTGPGGHAWEAAGSPSAIHAAAELVASIGAMRPRPGTSVNVGRIGGGEGINMRARHAWFELDIRADDPVALREAVRDVDALLATVSPPLSLEATPLGERPAGRIAAEHPLVRAAKDSLAEIGETAATPATSTDANAAHGRDIPAIAVGVTRGGDEHTTQEWIEIDRIEDGVHAVARTVERFEELRS
jgi:tripeptide aminopeptidase